MQVPNPQPAVKKLIWLCGKPRFLLESLCYSLQQTFHARYLCEMSGAEPPDFTMPEHAQWLIWFLGNQYPVSRALDEFIPLDGLSLVLVERNGNIVVCRADGTETRQMDISLQDLVRILQMPLPEHS